MEHKVRFLVALIALSLMAGCADAGPPATPSAPGCPSPDGEGTVSPAVAIASIRFVVNGVEQVVRDGDTLQALPGDQVQLKEATLCAGSFSGDGGEACVDLVPVDASGREIASEHGGTHLLGVTPGLLSIPGPEHSWIIDESWTHFSAVLNHWPPEATADASCAERRCERDDRMIVELGKP